MPATSSAKSSKKTFQDAVAPDLKNKAKRIYCYLIAWEAANPKRAHKGRSSKEIAEILRGHGDSGTIGARLTDLSKAGMIVVARVVKDGKATVQCWRSSVEAERRALRKIGAIGRDKCACNARVLHVLLHYLLTTKGRTEFKSLSLERQNIIRAFRNEAIFQWAKEMPIDKIMQLADSGTKRIRRFRTEAVKGYAAKWRSRHGELKQKVLDECFDARRRLSLPA